MTQNEFEVFLHGRINKIVEVLQSKAREYSSETDRMHNFHVAARIMDIPPRQALWGMALKHLVSVMDIIKYPDRPYSYEHLGEKIGDLINYLVLLEAMVKDEKLFQSPTPLKTFLETP